jgi:hypothetical protein
LKRGETAFEARIELSRALPSSPEGAASVTDVQCPAQFDSSSNCCKGWPLVIATAVPMPTTIILLDIE